MAADASELDAALAELEALVAAIRLQSPHACDDILDLIAQDPHSLIAVHIEPVAASATDYLATALKPSDAYLGFLTTLRERARNLDRAASELVGDALATHGIEAGRDAA